MFRWNDLILLLVVFSSLVAGILLPGFGALFQPFPLYLMMFLLFLSFLSINLHAVWATLQKNSRSVVWISFLKLIGLPVGIFFLFQNLCPTYAASALLLTAISTGVVAPFISEIVGGDGPLVLITVVITSTLVPFTLPPLVEILLGQSIHISLPEMVKMLSLVIFLPLAAVQVLKRLSPGILRLIDQRRYPISLLIFAIVNLGIFSKYADFFHQQPFVLVEAGGVAFSLGGIYFFAGIFSFWGKSAESQAGAAICLANMNNVLVMVFASEFFGPLEPTVAAMYIIPFFAIIFPLRAYTRLREGSKALSG